MTLHDQIKLLPCPFCGRRDLLGFEPYPENGFLGVRCRACGCIGPAGRSEDEREASANWTQRIGSDLLALASDARIAELEAVIVQAREALAWVVDQAGGPICEHEAGVCFCKENAAIEAIDALKGQP